MPISYASLTGGGKIQKTTVIKSTQSWTAPSDVTQVEVIICGGGGGGGSRSGQSESGGGGGGSAFYEVLSVSPGASYTVTIGAGGSTTPELSGSSGLSSSFGALFTAPGGGGGGRHSESGLGSGLGSDGGGFQYNAGLIYTGGSGFNGYGKGGGSKVYDYLTAGENLGGNANTGNGGMGISNGRNARSGDSGICIIKYWTAG